MHRYERAVKTSGEQRGISISLTHFIALLFPNFLTAKILPSFYFLHGEVPPSEIFRRRFLSSDLLEDWSGVQTTLYALRIGIDGVFEPEKICSAREQKYRRDGKTVFMSVTRSCSFFLQLFSVNVEIVLSSLRRLDVSMFRISMFKCNYLTWVTSGMIASNIWDCKFLRKFTTKLLPWYISMWAIKTRSDKFFKEYYKEKI